MTEDTNLTEGREELKRQLADGEYKSSIDRILDAMGRILRKLTRRSKPPAFWISALAIALLVSLIGILGALLTGGVPRDGVRTLIVGGVLLFLLLVIPRTAFNQTFATLQNRLLDGLESNAGLTDLSGWLRPAI